MNRSFHNRTLQWVSLLAVLSSNSVRSFRPWTNVGRGREPPSRLRELVPPPKSRLLRIPSSSFCLHSTAVEREARTSARSVDDIKADLIRTCARAASGARSSEVSGLVEDLERAGEAEGVGQCSSVSGLLSGEWELVHASEDVTRSSPFFWAFRSAFPESADQIYGITDSIPDPIKVVGPAIQRIDFDGRTSGRFVSKVKVATLGGMATSIMTTRGTIQGAVGTDGIRVKVETTKPENSTFLQTLLGAALGSVVNENLPAFPSGEALERVKPGSSVVEMRNTFVDEEVRVCRYRDNDYFIWKRRQFSTYDFL